MKNIKRVVLCYLSGIFTAKRAMELIAKELGIKVNEYDTRRSN